MPDDYAREQARRIIEENNRRQKELVERQQQTQRQMEALQRAAENTRVRELAESQQYAREVIEQQNQAIQAERDETFRRTMEAVRDADMEVTLVDPSKPPREDPRGDRSRRDQDRIREDGSRQQALSARLHNERVQEVARRASQEPVLRDAYERRGPASESYRDSGVRDREDRTRQAADAARAAETRDRENRPQQTRDAARAAETRDRENRTQQARDAAHAAETRDRENRTQQARDAARAAETRDSQVRQERVRRTDEDARLRDAQVRRTEDDRRLADTQVREKQLATERVRRTDEDARLQKEQLETDDAGSATASDRDSLSVSPYAHPKVDLTGIVDLIDVEEREFAQVLQVLKNSTSAGQQVAKLIEAGKVRMVLTRDKFRPEQQGAAKGKDAWITVGSSPQETAGTILHEITHYIDQADKNPDLSRTELEANAHEAEFAFRRHVGLPVKDPVKDRAEEIYRRVLDRRRAQGDSDSVAQAAARKALIVLMLRNSVLYGIEAGNKGPLMARAIRTTSGTNSPQQNVAMTPPGRSGLGDISFTLTADERWLPGFGRYRTIETEKRVGIKLEQATGLKMQNARSKYANMLNGMIAQPGRAPVISLPVLLSQPILTDPLSSEQPKENEAPLGSTKPDYVYLTPDRIEVVEVTVDSRLQIVPQLKGLKFSGAARRRGDPHKQIQIRTTLQYLMRRYPDMPIVYNIQTIGEIPPEVLKILETEIVAAQNFKIEIGSTGKIQIILRSDTETLVFPKK